VHTLLQGETEKIATLRSRPVLASPHGYIDKLRDDLISVVRQGSINIERRVELAGQNLIGLQGQLRTLSPQNTLERGYAIVRNKTRKVVSRVAGVKPGETITIRISDGELEATAND
jgi:exodeoxyribonuclease VII large subunit